MKAYTFRISISYHLFMQHYNGVAKTVLIECEQGLRLQLPATRFRPYLTHAGINGRFRIIIDENNRIKQMDRLG
ncbi:DUF2835 family protein [Thaumasiovibrio subtropicus]|uniref:DUF2835 family protein n=1 Tax=Thaumasiovibrio subtropicus TaxID=1891207 RepID=UPI000B363C9F|nr:DUF2835 family protein [Thaumasiovibrio subtropicus]